MLKIINLKNIVPTDVDIVNSAYKLWSDTYHPILKEAGERLDHSSFFGCKYLCAILKGNKVEALSLHREFDLGDKSLIENNYFNPLPESLKQNLLQHGHTIYTVEWVTCSPEYRGKMGIVVFGCAFRSFLDTDCTLAMGFSRTDLKADKIAESFGFKNMGMTYRHDIECGIMMMTKADYHPHKYESIQKVVDELYLNRNKEPNKMKTKIENCIKTVGDKLVAMNLSNQSTYEAWLSQAYYFVKHSTPMLALSAGLVKDREYHIRCIEHLAEEKGHDKMLLNDLKFLGKSFDQFPTLPATQSLYQTQYYWIEHVNPKSFMGYIFLLEGLAVYCGAKLLEQVKDFKGNTFLKSHSEDDVDHMESAWKFFDTFTLEDQDQIVKNCELATQLYINMIEEIKSFADQGKQSHPESHSLSYKPELTA